MKYLDCERLGLMSAALANRRVGDKVLMGRIEAYSCKPLSDDKRLKKELELSFREDGAHHGGEGREGGRERGRKGNYC
ncbi:hypothetical protein NSK_008731 [Nannochloropsis salina CCMP1776]|uniref:Uncharacterized protein n=1 Tax=Nannochloropsis salina CCMP1776 TaxID=1027361 RepID=A0A4D9CQT0_9STRA|nr:hypothetical protein NSK_008731 [Nannochloropsis salina CCMP1776]|eukprot:TFJ79923.1 hypothetical protein NSK_008731 [Nannochloropsis salina CCMP1776]